GLRSVRRLGCGHGAHARRLPLRTRLSVVRPEPEVRQPQRAPRQGGCAHAARPYARCVRVLVRTPHPASIDTWRALGWRAAPDPVLLAREHEDLCTLLENAGVELVRAEGDPDNLDSIYAFDPALRAQDGVVLLRPGKPA